MRKSISSNSVSLFVPVTLIGRDRRDRSGKKERTAPVSLRRQSHDRDAAHRCDTASQPAYRERLDRPIHSPHTRYGDRGINVTPRSTFWLSGALSRFIASVFCLAASYSDTQKTIKTAFSLAAIMSPLRLQEGVGGNALLHLVLTSGETCGPRWGVLGLSNPA